MINTRASILVIISCSALGIVVVSNYLTFDSFAVDTCDSSSNCTNTQTGTGNSQTNDCTDLSICRNEANGNDNTQNNDCSSVPGIGDVPGCSNVASGDGNTQTNHCDSIPANEFIPGCFNRAAGDSNTQNNVCNSLTAIEMLRITIVTRLDDLVVLMPQKAMIIFRA